MIIRVTLLYRLVLKKKKPHFDKSFSYRDT